MAGETARLPSRGECGVGRGLRVLRPDQPELGGRFYDEIERLIAEACAHPRMYRRLRGEVRRHFTAAFPYGILFEDCPAEVRILAVIGLHQDPDYWLHRLAD